MNKLQVNRIRKNMAGGVYLLGLVGLVLAFTLGMTGSGNVLAAPLAATAPDLGAASGYSVLGKAGVMNTGNSVLSGKVGADLLTAITGFPPGIAASLVAAPDVNGAEAAASTADLAMTAQAGSATSAGPDLTGATLVPGVYNVGSASLPGTLTLNGGGVYIFLADALTFSGNVSLINGADACNVFWHVSSGAVITGGKFVGTIIAGTSITLGEGASVNGRVLALTGNVTLINNHIYGPDCAAATVVAAGVTATPSSLFPSTGADLAEQQALATRQWIRVGLVGVSLGLLAFGLLLRRKIAK